MSRAFHGILTFAVRVGSAEWALILSTPFFPSSVLSYSYPTLLLESTSDTSVLATAYSFQ